MLQAGHRSRDYFHFLIEKDGLGVSQAVHWNTRVVNSYLRIDNQIIPISGTLAEVQ